MGIRDNARAASEHRRYRPYTCRKLGAMQLRSLTAFERQQIELSKYTAGMLFDANEAAKIPARMFVAMVCDEDKKAVFTADDVEWLKDLDDAYADPLREACQEHAELDVETAKKN